MSRPGRRPQGSFLMKAADMDGDGLRNLVLLDKRMGLIEVVRNLTGISRLTTPMTLAAAQDFTLNFQNLQHGKGDVNLTIPAEVGSGECTVSYRVGNLVVSDRTPGPVLIRPLTETRSLTITAP